MKFTPLILAFLFLTITENVVARDWASYSSDNFIIYSNDRPRDITDSLEKLEVFRTISLSILKLPHRQENQRLKIFMFATNREFNKFSQNQNIIGFFFNAIDGPRMMVSPGSRGDNNLNTLFHEYIHYLVNEHSSFSYPRWYQEGLAEILSNIVFNWNSISIGMPAEGRISTFEAYGKLNIEDLLKLQEEDSSDIFQYRFYALSWLLTHYLTINTFTENQELIPKTIDYLKRYNQGEDPLLAFEESFQRATAEMDADLNKYLRVVRGSAPILTTARIDYQGDINQSELSDFEIAFMLAEVALSLGSDENTITQALQTFDGSNINDVSPKTASLLAIVYGHQENFDQASTYVDLAQVSVIEDSNVHSNLSHYFLDLYKYSIEHTDSPELNSLEEALRLAQFAINIDMSNVSAHYSLAQAYQANSQLDKALDSALTAYELSVFNPSIISFLIELTIITNDYDSALYLAERLYSTTHSAQNRQKLLELIVQIKEGNVDWESIEL